MFSLTKKGFSEAAFQMATNFRILESNFFLRYYIAEDLAKRGMFEKALKIANSMNANHSWISKR